MCHGVHVAEVHQWQIVLVKRVMVPNALYRRAGKAKLRVLLLADGFDVKESAIGSILASLKLRNLLIEPMNGVRTRRAKSPRLYATRVPPDKRKPTVPGALIQVDTVHIRPSAGPQRRQFTAIDVVSRCAVLVASAVGIRLQPARK